MLPRERKSRRYRRWHLVIKWRGHGEDDAVLVTRMGQEKNQSNEPIFSKKTEEFRDLRVRDRVGLGHHLVREVDNCGFQRRPPFMMGREVGKVASSPSRK